MCVNIRSALYGYQTKKTDKRSLQDKCSENFFDEYYIAPEILTDRKARENADIYSLGTIYYTMLTGELPKKSRKRMKSGSVLKVADAEEQRKINLLAEVNPDKRPSSIREFWNAGKREGGNQKHGQK